MARVKQPYTIQRKEKEDKKPIKIWTSFKKHF